MTAASFSGQQLLKESTTDIVTDTVGDGKSWGCERLDSVRMVHSDTIRLTAWWGLKGAREDSFASLAARVTSVQWTIHCGVIQNGVNIWWKGSSSPCRRGMPKGFGSLRCLLGAKRMARNDVVRRTNRPARFCGHHATA